MHTFSTRTLASLALLSTLLSGVIAQPAAIGNTPELKEYEALIQSKLEAETELNGPSVVDTARRSVRNHGRRHVHLHEQQRPTAVKREEVTSEVSNKEKRNINAPVVSQATYLGPTSNNPSLYYFDPQPQPSLPDLTSSGLLKVNTDVVTPLANNYPMFNGSGTMSVSNT